MFILPSKLCHMFQNKIFFSSFTILYEKVILSNKAGQCGAKKNEKKASGLSFGLLDQNLNGWL